MPADQNPFEPPKGKADSHDRRFAPAPGKSIAEHFEDRRARQKRWVLRANLVAALLVGAAIGVSAIATLFFPNSEKLLLFGQLAAVFFVLVGVLVYIFAPVVWYYQNSS